MADSRPQPAEASPPRSVQGAYPDMVMLVDQHTLDSYIAACALRPERVQLVYHNRMAGAYEALAAHLRRRLGIDVTGLEVAEDSSLEDLELVLDSLPPDAHLHYTGGTGALSAQCSLIFERRRGQIGSYLDEERHMLHFADGLTVKLRPLIDDNHVTFDDIAHLQGYSIVNTVKVRDTAERGRQDALILACAVLEEPLASAERQRLAEIQSAAGKSKPWRTFVTGGWLEILTATAVRQVAPDYEVSVGVRLKRGKPTLELDVVAIGRYHPYIISCSTSSNGDEAKEKLFEVNERTRRLAGSVGRPAVATLIDEHSRPTPARLVEDLKVPWVSPTEPSLFDRSTVRGWLRELRSPRSAGSDAPDQLLSLRRWIQS